MRFDWTPRALDLLRRRVAEGASLAMIAAELGCSRNAACGKADRLGLRDERPRRVRRRAERLPEPVVLLDEIMALDAGDGVPLHRLRLRHCRWVEHVAPPWVFCGAATVRGTSYCGVHAARIYMPRRT